MRPADLKNQLVLALVFLTRMPLGGLLPEREVPLMHSLWAFPLAGALVGAVSALPLMLLPGPPLVLATLAVLLAIWLTGGLHEDGLADFTDGMGGADRAERLRIMRDPYIGSYGTLALILCIVLRVVSIAALGPLALIGAAAGGRAAMVLALTILPPARSDGLGRAAGRPGKGQALVSGLIGLAALALSGPMALAGLIGLILAAGLVIRLARTRLGGQTGDVLGTVSVLGETAALTAMAVYASRALA